MASGFSDDRMKFQLEQPPVSGGGGTPPPPSGGDGFTNQDTRTIASQNTVPALSAAPDTGKALQLFVNGKYENLNDSFTVAANTVTWIPAAAGYDLEVGYEVVVFYSV